MEDTKKTNEVATIRRTEVSNGFQIGQQKIVTNLIGSLATQLNKYSLTLSDYQKTCLTAAINVMNDMALKEGRDFSSFNQSIINSILYKIAMFNLNMNAIPKECYLQFRNTKNAKGDWVKEFEFGLEGDGNDKILRKYGVNIKAVHQPWLIHEGDDFSFPQYKGLGMSEPTWTPKSSSGKIIRVLYPIEMKDGTAEYLISEREDVSKNLKAHISNNMLGSKYDGVRAKILDKISNMSLDAMLDDKDLETYISPAWRNPQSRDAMILRKMRNNATKNYPKDFNNSFIADAYQDTYDDYDQYRKNDSSKNIEAEVVNEIDNSGEKPLQIEKPSEKAPIISSKEAKTIEKEENSKSSKEDIAAQIDGLGLGW